MEVFKSEIGSLAAVFSFEAAARLGSFTLAANELNVSQAAVSKQIAGLEERIGTTLFLRKHRHVVLTLEGQRLYSAANAGLGSIAGTMREIRLSRNRPLTIALSLALTRFWFIPVLPEFRQLHTNIPVRVLSDDDASLSLAHGVDLVIKYERSESPPPRARRLFRASVRAMASPEFLERNPVKDVSSVMQAPRIAYEAPGQGWLRWDDWLSATGAERPLSEPSLSVTTYHDALIAAQQHQGIVLVWNNEGTEHSDSNGLVPVPGPEIAVPGGFFLLSHDRPSPEADLMIDWLSQKLNG